MSVWYCVPSARPDGGTLAEWKSRGYRLAVWRDTGAPMLPFSVDFMICDVYPGYAKAVNALVREALARDAGCDWVVTGGDDVSPDVRSSPDEIGETCLEYFSVNSHWQRGATFGVMQPTGDRWGADEPWSIRKWPNAPAYIDRICGSPWMGREFCRRANAGIGPLCEAYEHMYVDEHLQAYARKYGILWQRPDLTHYHHHALRGGKPQSSLPPHLKPRYEGTHFRDAKAIFDRHVAYDFAGLEPIA